MGGKDLTHRLLAFAANDDVEIREKGFGVARRQRSAGDQQAAVAAQMLGEPQAILRQGGHAVNAHDLCVGREGLPESAVAAQEGAVEQLHLVSGRLQAGREIGHPKRREAEAGPVEPPSEERVDEQHRGHEALSMVRS